MLMYSNNLDTVGKLLGMVFRIWLLLCHLFKFERATSIKLDSSSVPCAINFISFDMFPAPIFCAFWRCTVFPASATQDNGLCIKCNIHSSLAFSVEASLDYEQVTWTQGVTTSAENAGLYISTPHLSSLARPLA